MRNLIYIFISASLTASAMGWTPPIGIPAPNWGGTIGNPIETPTPKPPKNWTSNIPNVYFVQSGGTNSGTGYPSNPRGEIPRILPAGTVVFLNGTYTKVHSPAYLHPDGNPNAPVWITSYDPEHPATCTGNWVFYYDPTYHCDYLIVDGVNWDVSASGGTAIDIGGSVNHLCFRGGSVKGVGKSDPTDPHYTDSGPAYNNNTVNVASSYSLDVLPTEQIIFSGMNISRGGNWQYTEGDPDAQGIAVGFFVKDVWVLDCEFSYFSGCAVMFGAGSIDSTPDTAAGQRMYLGRNYAHHIAQSAFWTKRSVDCVMSQNRVQTIRRDTPSSPNAGGMGAQYGPKNLWIIFNDISDSQSGIAFGSGASGGSATETAVYIVGNVIHDIHDKSGPPDDWRGNPHSGGGTAILLRGQLDHYIVNNTITDYDAGILCPLIANNRFIEGNIFSNRNAAVSGGEIICSNDAGRLNVIRNNIITPTGGATYIQCGDPIYRSLAALNSAKGPDNIGTTPTFVNAAAGDYSLTASSAGIDAFGSKANAVYDLFMEKYGRSIRFDKAGTSRPQGESWDIGAFEFNMGGGPQSLPPSKPQGTKIKGGISK